MRPDRHSARATASGSARERTAPGGDLALTPETLRETRHRLRTPLNHIIGYSEMLLEAADDLGLEALVPDLEQVHTAGQRLLGQLDHLLGPAQAAAGTIDAARLGVELRTPLTAVVGYTEILLEAAADLGQPAVTLDLERIHSASKHLLGLIDYVLDLARPETDASAAAPQPVSPRSPAALSSASEAPADGATARGPVGTTASAGADGIAPVPAAHAGLGAGREPGADAAEDARPAAAAADLAAPTAYGSLLVVDDNALNRDVLARRLERLGYTVATAEHGRQALEMLGAAPYDLVLLDILMPEMDGYEVLRRLKADERLRHVPVVVLSALDEVESVVRCVELGADDYLPKPFNPALLRARIGASLEKKRLRDQEVWYRQQIEAERQRADELLHVILPDEIVRELKTTDGVAPRRYEQVAVLFCDIVGFTPYCDQRQPQEVLTSLQQLVEVYEDLAARYEMQKIKTIGDAFMAVAGLLTPVENPVLNCVRCGLEMIAAAPRLTAEWNVRVGIHVGPVVAGVLGRRQYLFDLWGDTVNTAARMESSGVAGTITLSRAAWEAVAAEFPGERVGAIPVKGKGDLEVFRIAPAG